MDRISGRSLAARLFGASPARTLALLHAAWPLAVGPDLARRTEVLGLENGTMRLRVPDARWRKVLHRMQPQILAHLRELTGDLAPRRMGFVEGGIAPDSERQLQGDSDPGVERRKAAVDDGGFQGGPRTPILPGVSAPPEIEVATAINAAQIADPEIRERFVAAAARYLARSKDSKGKTHA